MSAPISSATKIDLPIRFKTNRFRDRPEKPGFRQNLFTYPVNPCLLLAVGLGAEFLE
jgi:hypothetical protein